MEQNHFESHVAYFLMTEARRCLWQTDSALCCLSTYFQYWVSDCHTWTKWMTDEQKVLPVKLSDPLWPKQTVSLSAWRVLQSLKCSGLVIYFPLRLSCVTQAEDFKLYSQTQCLGDVRMVALPSVKCTPLNNRPCVSWSLYGDNSAPRIQQ